MANAEVTEEFASFVFMGLRRTGIIPDPFAAGLVVEEDGIHCNFTALAMVGRFGVQEARAFMAGMLTEYPSSPGEYIKLVTQGIGATVRACGILNALFTVYDAEHILSGLGTGKFTFSPIST